MTQSIVMVRNLSTCVYDDYLKSSFATFFTGVENAYVIVDKNGNSTGKGLIYFKTKKEADYCVKRCSNEAFMLTRSKRVIVQRCGLSRNQIHH